MFYHLRTILNAATRLVVQGVFSASLDVLLQRLEKKKTRNFKYIFQQPKKHVLHRLQTIERNSTKISNKIISYCTH